MRILHVIPTLGPLAGGANVSCFDLCRQLALLGEEVAIFSTGVDIPPDVKPIGTRPVVKSGVTLRFFPVIGPKSYPISPLLFRALAKTIPTFDIVHIHSLYRPHLAVAAYYCRKNSVPYVVKPHGSVDPYMYGRKRFRKTWHEILFDAPAYRAADAIQFTADDEMRLAVTTGFFGRQRINGVVIPNAVVIPEGLRIDEEPPRVDKNVAIAMYDQFPLLKDKTIILFLGRINFKKGLDLLARAFPQILDRHPDAVLVIAGPDNEGYGEKVKTWLREGHVLERTLFTGMLSGEKKQAMFEMANVFVLSSYSENFGVAILEAMCALCPVVISNKVNIWREIADAKAGVVVDCKSDDLASAVVRILEDPALANTLRNNALRLVREKFTWEKVAPSMLQLYKSIIARREGSART